MSTTDTEIVVEDPTAPETDSPSVASTRSVDVAVSILLFALACILGFDNWRKLFAYAAESGGPATPILIENTAGGDNACARRLDALARLWDAIGEYEVGFCLDTCHAYAAGEDLLTIVDRVKAITGRIDLVHANGSRDPFDSGRDRHDNLESGTIDADLVVEVIRAAGAPAVVETPGGAAGQAADIAYLRDRLGE